MTKLRTLFVLAAGWLILSTWLLTLPGEKVPTENILTRLQVDKLVHFIMFFVLVVVWCWSVAGRYPGHTGLKKIFTGIAILCFAWGIGMEFVQRSFIINRSFDYADMLADGAGSAIGLIFSRKRYIKK